MDDKNHHSTLQRKEELPRLQFGHLLIATNIHSFIKLQKVRYTVPKIKHFRPENTIEVSRTSVPKCASLKQKYLQPLYPNLYTGLHTQLLRTKAMLL